jgi:RNase P/RNase MRP subunit p29
LFLGVIGILVFSLCFKDAQHSTQGVKKKVVDPTRKCVMFEPDLPGVKKVPVARL